MVFKKHNWKGLGEGSRGDITGEINIKENKRIIDHFSFNDNEGYNGVIIAIKKYGFGRDVWVNTKKKNKQKEKKDSDEEIEFLNRGDKW